MDGDYMIPALQLPSNGTNLLILLGWVLLILWVYRIVRKFHLLYRLNVAIASGQVCATPIRARRDHTHTPRTHTGAPARGSCFCSCWGGLWRTLHRAWRSPVRCLGVLGLVFMGAHPGCARLPRGSLVVRLQTSHMTATERDMLFGEMSMLWRTNMQQQLLRARRISCAIDVTQLQVCC